MSVTARITLQHLRKGKVHYKFVHKGKAYGRITSYQNWVELIFYKGKRKD